MNGRRTNFEGRQRYTVYIIHRVHIKKKKMKKNIHYTPTQMENTIANEQTNIN